VRQRGHAHQERKYTDQAQRRGERRPVETIAPAQHQPDQAPQQDRQRIGTNAEEREHDVGEIRPGHAAEIVDRPGDAARVRPARIVRVVADQAGQQVQQDRHRQQNQAFPPDPASRATLVFHCLLCSAHRTWSSCMIGTERRIVSACPPGPCDRRPNAVSTPEAARRGL